MNLFGRPGPGPYLVVLFPALLIGTAGGALAADDYEPTYLPEMQVSRAPGPIEIDGELDDPGWRGAAVATGFAEHSPGDQVQPPVRTEALMTYDDRNVYVAFRCYDDPGAVRVSLCERDRIWSDDTIIVAIDTYADQSWAYELGANPYGIQGDALWSANGGEDDGYDAIYYSDGRITDFGYQVEMAIPFSSLRFPRRSVQTWRMDFWRNHPRETRGQYSWAAYDRDDPCWPCQWGTVFGIEDVEPGKGLEVLPAFVSTQAGSRNPEGEFENEDVMGEPSLGVKYALTSAVTAEVAVNPDFSQVEADAAQTDVNSTFALFFPERRPFFQEGSDLFNTFFNAVYTRSINDPLFAAKMTGRPGRTNIAFLSARDERSPVVIPLEERSAGPLDAGKSYVNILRVQRTLGEGSFLGLVATDRRLDQGGSGTVLGADGRIRLGRNYQVEMQILATCTVEPDDSLLTADPHLGLAGVEFDGGKHTAVFDGEKFWGRGIYGSLERNGRSWNLDLDYWERSPTFRADNGYEPRNNQRMGQINSGYVFYFEDGLVEMVNPFVNLARIWNFDDVKKDEWVNANISVRLKWAQSNFHAQYLRSNENFGGTQFGDIYGWHQCGHLVPSDLVRCSYSLNYGHRIARWAGVMGKETLLTASVDLKPVDRLLLENSFVYIKSTDRTTDEELYKDHILRSRLTLQVTRELSTRLVIQYRDFAETWEADPLITYRLNPLSIFYVGSTRDYGNLTPEEHGVQGWRLTDRQYFMKLQYLFRL